MIESLVEEYVVGIERDTLKKHDKSISNKSNKESGLADECAKTRKKAGAARISVPYNATVGGGGACFVHTFYLRQYTMTSLTYVTFCVAKRNTKETVA